MSYKKYNRQLVVITTSYDLFHYALLQKIQQQWDKTGNDIIGISNDKMYRIFSGKQKDLQTLFDMAEFMEWHLTINLY